MKVTRQQVARHRARILDRAAKLFREKGFGGIGVADIMKSAGLTHGAFYGHFASKDELMAQACAKAAAMAHEGWTGAAGRHPENPLAAIVRPYLSARHRDDRANGCLYAALGAEAGRESGAVRGVFTEGLRESIELLAKIAPGRSRAARREKAVATIAGLVGALTLARAVDDQALSDEILRAAAVRLSPDTTPARARRKPS
jgi:TetR/AcrR family transcriptional repressor of nem operon